MRQVLDGREFRGGDIVPADDRGGARPPTNRRVFSEMPSGRESGLPLRCILLESGKTPPHS